MRTRLQASRRYLALLLVVVFAVRNVFELQTALAIGSRKAVVTGAGGYVGREVCCQLLERGWDVLACVRDSGAIRSQELISLVASQNISSGDASRFRVVSLDVIDQAAVRSVLQEANPNVVFHIAAVFRPSDNPIQDIVNPNVDGVDAIMRACAAVDSQPVVVLTSSMASVRGPQQPFRQGCTCYDHLDVNSVSSPDEQWHGAYQHSKAKSETLAWRLAEEFGVGVIALCPSAIIGPERRLPDKAPKRFPWMRWDAQPVGSMLSVDVRDVARAHVAAGEAGHKLVGQRFIVSSEVPIPVSGLANAFRMLTVDVLGEEEALRIASQALSIDDETPEVMCTQRLRENLNVECRHARRTLVDMAEDHMADRRRAIVRSPSWLEESGAAQAVKSVFSALFPA